MKWKEKKNIFVMDGEKLIVEMNRQYSSVAVKLAGLSRLNFFLKLINDVFVSGRSTFFNSCLQAAEKMVTFTLK